MGFMDSLSKGLEQGKADVKEQRRIAEQTREQERKQAQPNKVAMAFGRAIERVAPAKDKVVHGAKAADKAIDRIQGKKPVTQARGRAPAPKRQGTPKIVITGGKPNRAVSTPSGNMSSFASGPDHAGVYGGSGGGRAFQDDGAGPSRFAPDSGFRSDTRFHSNMRTDSRFHAETGNISRFAAPRRRW